MKSLSNNSRFQFRVFDPRTKTFSYFDLRGAMGQLPLDIEDRYINQFTGLLDKNGNKIFEGDIIKVKSYDGWFDQFGFYFDAVVFYSEGIAAFVYANRPELGCGTRFDPPRLPDKIDIEVIGNIFETPKINENSN